MANLRGGTFDKQLKDAFHRLEKFGEKRHMSNTNFTHSLELAKKRDMYFRDFKAFLEQKGVLDGKINQMLKKDVIREFISKRTHNLSPKSALDYVTGFNSTLKGLEQANVTIPANPTKNDVFKDFRENFRAEIKELSIEKGRYIQNLEQKLQELYKKDYNIGVISELQAKTGLRVSEAFEVVKNFDKYHNQANSTLENVVGKGNHVYAEKQIEPHLAQKIEKIDNLPSYKEYLNSLKEVSINKSHDFRVTYAKDKYIELKELGFSEKEALKAVSKEINHHREEMTRYYLARA